MSGTKDRAAYEAFLDEYEAIARKHGIGIMSCNCCGLWPGWPGDIEQYLTQIRAELPDDPQHTSDTV